MNELLAIATEVCNGTTCETVDVDGGAVAGLVAALGGFIVFFIIIALAVFGFWLWMMIDSVRTEEEEYKKLDKGEKTLWVALMIGSFFLNLSLVMALVYYFVVYRVKKVSPKK